MKKNLLIEVVAEIQDLIQFLVSPTRKRYNARYDSWLSLRFFILLILVFLLIVTISLPIDHALQNFADISAKDENVSYSLLADLFIFAPILEECIFRAGLRSATYTLLVGPVLIAAIFAGKVCTVAAVMSLLAANGYLMVERYTKKRHRPEQRFFRNRQFIRWYPVIFWCYAGAFALAHVVNHTFSGWKGILVVFSITPQLFLAAAAGYLRLRNGVSSAIAFHMAYNLIAVLLFIF